MKVIIFDADGVLTLPNEFFGDHYARKNNLDINKFIWYFNKNWPDVVTGKKDTKESINENRSVWSTEEPAEKILEQWFVFEDKKDEDLIDTIKKMRHLGHRCYLATDQEKYRAQYMREVMFKGLFDDYFVSSDLGVTKKEPMFFKKVIEKLGVDPADIIFFDDSQSKVDSAKSVGIDARLYMNRDQVKNVLNEKNVER